RAEREEDQIDHDPAPKESLWLFPGSSPVAASDAFPKDGAQKGAPRPQADYQADEIVDGRSAVPLHGIPETPRVMSQEESAPELQACGDAYPNEPRCRHGQCTKSDDEPAPVRELLPALPGRQKAHNHQ